MRAIEWPRTFDDRQLRRFALTWCLLPPAQLILPRPDGPPALALIARTIGGDLTMEIAAWHGQGAAAAAPESDFQRHDLGHAILVELYGSDPLASLGPASSAFLACVPEGARTGVVATIVLIDDELVCRVVTPDVDREATLAGLTGEARELRLRHRAMQGLNEIAETLRAADPTRNTPRGRRRGCAEFDAVVDDLARAWRVPRPPSGR